MIIIIHNENNNKNNNNNINHTTMILLEMVSLQVHAGSLADIVIHQLIQ